MTAPGLDLRSIVAEVVREIVAETSTLQRRTGQSPEHDSLTVRSGTGKVETVRIVDDSDLDRFARRLVSLFENPKNRQDLRAGRLRFVLDASSTRKSHTTSHPALRFESGAVTERHVKEASDQGRRIVLGRRAVVTPLGRERARALGVSIEKER